MSDPSTPAAAYQAIIDQLVEETRLSSVFAVRAEKNSPFPVESGKAEFNELIGSLSERQRLLLSSVLLDERHGAMHDVLAVLSW
jgi:hypothetical protein